MPAAMAPTAYVPTAYVPTAAKAACTATAKARPRRRTAPERIVMPLAKVMVLPGMMVGENR